MVDSEYQPVWNNFATQNVKTCIYELFGEVCKLFELTDTYWSVMKSHIHSAEAWGGNDLDL